MNFKRIANAATSKFGMQMLKAQKHSPHIMFGAGVVGVVATVVLASRATLKLDEVLEDTDYNLGRAKKLFESDHPQYSEKDYQKDKVVTYAQAVTKIAKLYGPAILVGSASIGLLTGSHVVLTRRNTGLMAAYAAVDRAYREYDKRVVAELGADKARELRHGSEEVEIYSETKEGEPVVDRVRRAAGGGSRYARFWGEGNANYEPTHEYNIIWLRSQQNYLNDRLQRHGVVMLNDVYDHLGLSRSADGALVGWVKNNPKGDGNIDFGIWADERMEHMHDFMTGRENQILLDFNVDGIVYDQI